MYRIDTYTRIITHICHMNVYIDSMYICIWEAAEKALPEGGRITGAPWGPALSGSYKAKACETPSETMKFEEASENGTSAVDFRSLVVQL